jgi:Xaa-Pro aminopeptidase
MAHEPELQLKQSRLNAFLDRHGLDGVYLQRRNNFAWITGGRDNHILNASPAGVAAILATKDGKRVCFTNTIEGPRFAGEELAGLGIDVVAYLWHDPAAANKMLGEVIAGRRIAADVNDIGEFNHMATGMSKLPGDFDQLRWALTDGEIARYRDGGRRASMAMEKTCSALRPGMSEHEIAGVLDHEVHATGCNPVVTLVAVDDRIRMFRHPIPTNTKLSRHAMLVTCADLGGLISNLTRFVHFGPLPDDLKKRHQAVANVDATINFATTPGRTLGELFGVIAKAYSDNGFPGEEKLHHQGGSTGYNGRDVFAEPHTGVKVLDRQAFAWNPSITGTKSEDTIIVLGNKIEVLTAASKDWPKVTGRTPDGRTLERADMLVM